MKIMMLSKKDNRFCDYAQAMLKSYFDEDEVLSVRGCAGSPFDEDLYWHHPEYVISFLSPWIIKAPLLRSAEKAAINFHPGSPDYPGIGCYNFALYERAKLYGVTCHHMREKVDSGPIIMTSCFPVSKNETVETLKLKSMIHMLSCFEEILDTIAAGQPLPVSSETWKRKPFTRKQMLDLFYISPDCTDEDEITHRQRACAYPSCKGLYTEVGKTRFYCEIEDRKPIV